MYRIRRLRDLSRRVYVCKNQQHLKGDLHMPASRTEKIERIQAEIKQLENQKKKLMQQEKEQERKIRTRRLIERGAILESLLDRADVLTNEDVKAVLTAALASGPAIDVLLPILKRQNAAAPTKAITAQGAKPEAPPLRKRNAEAAKAPEATQNKGA